MTTLMMRGGRDSAALGREIQWIVGQASPFGVSVRSQAIAARMRPGKIKEVED
jgi:hypothetical protein